MIKINRAKCLHCEDVIESHHVHDFRICTCGSLCVDGGFQYIKRVFNDMHWVELAEYEEEDDD